MYALTISVAVTVSVMTVHVGVGFCTAHQAPAPPAPVPCCAPEQITLHFEQVGTKQKGDLGMEIVRETIDAAYDFANARVGLEVSAVDPVSGKETKLKFIQNLESGFQWVIEGHQCIKLPLSPTRFFVRCIPDGATFEGTFHIGLEKLKIHSWRIETNIPDEISANQTFTVTDYMCTPFSSTLIGKLTSTQPPTLFAYSGNYMNIVEKITDPARWFTLPPYCKNSTHLEDVTKPLTKIPQIHFF